MINRGRRAGSAAATEVKEQAESMTWVQVAGIALVIAGVLALEIGPTFRKPSNDRRGALRRPPA